MDVKTEINQLLRWNESLTRSLRDCSHAAASWIRAQIDENKALISTLNLMYSRDMSDEDDEELPDLPGISRRAA